MSKLLLLAFLITSSNAFGQGETSNETVQASRITPEFYYIPCQIAGSEDTIIYNSKSLDSIPYISTKKAKELAREGLLRAGSGELIQYDDIDSIVHGTVVRLPDIKIGNIIISDVLAIANEKLSKPITIGSTNISEPDFILESYALSGLGNFVLNSEDQLIFENSDLKPELELIPRRTGRTGVFWWHYQYYDNGRIKLKEQVFFLDDEGPYRHTYSYLYDQDGYLIEERTFFWGSLVEVAAYSPWKIRIIRAADEEFSFGENNEKGVTLKFDYIEMFNWEIEKQSTQEITLEMDLDFDEALFPQFYTEE